MYARIARFEGLDVSKIDEGTAEMRRQLDAARSGNLPEGAPEGVGELMQTVKRLIQFVDRKTGTAVSIDFCDTEDDLRRADAALNAMSPGEGGGRRTSVDLLEVVIDEAF